MSLRNLIIGLVMLASATVSAQADVDPRYYQLMGQADSLIALADWDGAEDRLLTALRLQPALPTNVMLVSNLGMVRFRAGKDSLALATLNDARMMAPTSLTVLQNRAHVLAALGRDREAFSDYDEVIRMDSMQLEARFRHGLLAMRLGDLNAAVNDFDFIERTFPGRNEAAIGFASYYSATGRPREAIPYYTRLIVDSPQAEYYAGRAVCFLLTDDLGSASEDIASGLSYDPTDSELYLYRAILNKMRYRIDDARADAERAISLGADPRRVRSFIP